MTLDQKKVDTIMRTKDHLQSCVNWLFRKELGIKINVRFFDPLWEGEV